MLSDIKIHWKSVWLAVGARGIASFIIKAIFQRAPIIDALIRFIIMLIIVRFSKDIRKGLGWLHGILAAILLQIIFSCIMIISFFVKGIEVGLLDLLMLNLGALLIDSASCAIAGLIGDVTKPAPR